MADFLPDDVLCNIIARLPAKPLLRFRCVSKYWNEVLTDPNFMKLRSRKSIILAFHYTFHILDDSVPTDDTSNSLVKRCYPFVNLSRDIKVIGTLNGIVVICAYANTFTLYNPFTGVSKFLPFPPEYYYTYKRTAYGFGYGSTPDDLKIVRITQYNEDFEVYNFRENSWSCCNKSKYNFYVMFDQEVGHFINGSLYWLACDRNALIAMDVKDLVLSEIWLPFTIEHRLNPLGTINGSLCSLNQITVSEFDMWVMKEHDQWSKMYSFKLPLNKTPYYALSILDGGRILMVDPSMNLIIYDTLTKSYKMFNISLNHVPLLRVHAFEYVESMVSPSDMCYS